MVSACVSDLMHRAQDVVEQALMPALLDEAAQRAGGERREIDRHQLRGDAAGDEGHQAGSLGRRHRFGQQPQREAREILAALAVAQPVGDERAEIDLAQFCLDRCRLEEMHLDEFAELVGDAVLVALDDRGVRDRQAQRPRNSATTAYQSARPPMVAASAKAATKPNAGCIGSSVLAAMKIANVAASTSVASSLTRRSSAARARRQGVSKTNVPGTVMTAFG